MATTKYALFATESDIKKQVCCTVIPVIINKDYISVIVTKISHCSVAQQNETYTFTAMRKTMDFMYCFDFLFEAGDCLNLCLSFLMLSVNVCNV